ncbi:hypothetical protein G7Y89_g10213 [Cudoniella acicularis]|uniref:GTP cyclohydrolase 1 n=1 Tax=Cudoniella acicularis TaxID=354080 RepID=A0A8H4RFI4_9HELO|nr:hypothetical protein G7Y89_g10213 [Cudoniella acicularis]
MATPTKWLLRLFALLSLVSLSFAHPHTTTSTTGDAFTRNIDRASEDISLNTRNFHLDKRTALPLYSDDEQRNLRALAKGINGYLEETDVVFFVGNSGSYLIYPFDTSKYQMKAIPNSKAKHYGTPGFTPTEEGLERYWNLIVGPPLLGRNIERIILVDHSGSGQSVDGFRRIVLDACQVAITKSRGAADGITARNDVAQIPMYLINVIDQSRSGTTNPIVDPQTVPVLAKLTVSGKGVVNKLLGDERRHPRVQPEYPPEKWEQPAKNSWASEEEKADGTTMSVNKNGGNCLVRDQIEQGELDVEGKEATEIEKEERLTKLSGAIRTILEYVGEDPNREGLLNTLERYMKAMLFFTKGYEEDL